MFVFGELAKKLSIEQAMNQIFKDAIVLNAYIDILQKSLYQTGKGADGQKLKTDKSRRSSVYATFTEIQKQKFNLPTDRVTLFDSGQFYDSFRVKAFKTYLEVYADFEKKDGNIAKNFQGMFTTEKEFESNILRPNAEAWAEFVNNEILPRLKESFLNV